MKPMTQVELLEKMIRERDTFNPPLKISEIIDFIRTELPDQKEYEENFDAHERYLKYMEDLKKWYFVNYDTKKEIKQAIKETNKEIEEWVKIQRTDKGFYTKFRIDECLEKKKKLEYRLKYKDWDKSKSDIEKAKSIPIDSLLEFNGAGFAKCPFHDEKTASLKYYPKQNHAYCFGGCGKHDGIDIVMKVQNLNFNQAVKYILK